MTTTSLPVPLLMLCYFAIFCGIFLALAMLKLPWLLRRQRRRHNAQKESFISLVPFPPTWLRPFHQDQLSRIEFSRIRVYTRPFKREFNRQGKEKRKESIEFAQSIINRYEGGKVQLPDDTCIVCIPMGNFHCHPASFQEFLPNFGLPPAYEFSYRFFGKPENIQITKYLTKTSTCSAGLILYIRTPYEKADTYWSHPIHQCYMGSQRSLGVAVQMPRDPRIQTERLKTKYCRAMEQPVMVGVEDGRSVHFEWDLVAKQFKTTKCASCDEEEGPPVYSFVNEGFKRIEASPPPSSPPQ